MKKCFLFAILLLQLSPAFAAPCAEPDEMQAIRVRALQTELMLAGLSCNGRNHYNHFVHSYRGELKSYANSLRGYFQRVYGAKAETEMNQFVTQLANDSSTRSMKRGATAFCESARQWFESTEQESKLENVDYSYSGSIHACH